jgi:hypothetical protein
VRADEKLTAFRELESAIRPASVELSLVTKQVLASQSPPQASQAEQSGTEQGNCCAAIENARRLHADVVEAQTYKSAHASCKIEVQTRGGGRGSHVDCVLGVPRLRLKKMAENRRAAPVDRQNPAGARG